MKIISSYYPKNHSESVTLLFCHIRGFYNINSLKYYSKCFISPSPLFFLISEYLISLFCYKKMMDFNWQPIINFSVTEKCRIVCERGAIACGLSEDLLNLISSINFQIKNCEIYKNDLRIMIFKNEIKMDLISIELVPLMNFLFELKKLQYQVSPTLMCFKLSSVIEGLATFFFIFRKTTRC